MDPRQDIRIHADYINANNDIELYLSDEDHILDTIQASQGAYKEHPFDGVGIDMYINSSGQEQILFREMGIQLRSDRYTVDCPELSYDTNGKLIINPNATL